MTAQATSERTIDMGAWVAVAVGGALGSMARYATIIGVGRLVGVGFPYGVLVANVVGGFIMGVLVELMALVWSPSDSMRIFLTVGVMGGYTTFSSFSLDTWLLLDKGLYGPALLYIAASVILSVAALVAGLTVTRMVLA
jgi:CrcB protein